MTQPNIPLLITISLIYLSEPLATYCETQGFREEHRLRTTCLDKCLFHPRQQKFTHLYLSLSLSLSYTRICVPLIYIHINQI